MATKIDSDAVNALVLLLVSGASDLEVNAACREQLGISEAVAERAIKEARKKITLAADFHRDHEIGQSKKRIEDIYKRSLRGSDFRTALAAQKELNRLLGLLNAADKGPSKETAGPADRELEAIRKHLLPLKLAPESYPLREHARIAADRIREAKDDRIT